MGFQLYKQKPVRASSVEPQASFQQQKIRFNQKAFINCELDKKPKVLFHTDEESRRVGFEFTDNRDSDYVYTVTPSKKGNTATVKIQRLLNGDRVIFRYFKTQNSPQNLDFPMPF